MSESIIDFAWSTLRGGRVYCDHSRGVEGSIVDMSIIVEESTLWLNRAVYTLTFGINLKCRPFFLFYWFQTSSFNVDIIYFLAYVTFYVLAIV